MATIDATKGGPIQPQLSWQKFAIQNLIDFSALDAASGDVIQAIKVPEGALVTNVKTIVVVAEGGTCTADIGVTGDDANGFNDAVDFNGTAGDIEDSASGTDAYATALGKYFSSDDTIDIVLDNAADTAKILVIAEGFFIENDTVHSTL